jgi:hypothetical protein
VITGNAILFGKVNVPIEYRYIPPVIIAASPPEMKNA